MLAKLIFWRFESEKESNFNFYAVKTLIGSPLSCILLKERLNLKIVPFHMDL